MKSYVVIPVREFSTTKLRLESILTEDERILLTRTLLERGLRAIEHSNVDQVIVVASDVEAVRKNFKNYPKLKTIRESHRYGGVNLAMQDGLLEISAEHPDSRTLLMPSDLPLLDSNALNNVLGFLDSHDLIICPSRKKDGTNLLGFVRKGAIPLHYDDDSFTKHLLEAEGRGLDYKILDSKEFSFDLDDEEDLKLIQTLKGAGSFQELIDKLGSG
jgi:2-phospho-L-lactate/phosphoenolpyruvate guanylyltransferase